MNKKIALSAMSILASLALLGGATFAFFSNAATSTGNAFSAGTLDLKLDDANEPTPADSVTASLSLSNMAPGQSTSGFISLHNGGSVAIAEVELGIDSTLGANPDATGDIRDVLNLTVVIDDGVSDSACVGGTGVTSTVDAAVGNGGAPLILKEFDDGGTDVYDALATPLAPGATTNVCFTVTLDSTAGNIYQGDAVTSVFDFTANQDVSQ